MSSACAVSDLIQALFPSEKNKRNSLVKSPRLSGKQNGMWKQWHSKGVPASLAPINITRWLQTKFAVAITSGCLQWCFTPRRGANSLRPCASTHLVVVLHSFACEKRSVVIVIVSGAFRSRQSKQKSKPVVWNPPPVFWNPFQICWLVWLGDWETMSFWKQKAGGLAVRLAVKLAVGWAWWEWLSGWLRCWVCVYACLFGVMRRCVASKGTSKGCSGLPCF